MAELKAADKLTKLGGGRKSNLRVSEKPSKTPTLAEQGIDKNLADAARKMAAMSEEKFEAGTERVKANAAAMALGEKAVIEAIRAEKNKRNCNKGARVDEKPTLADQSEDPSHRHLKGYYRICSNVHRGHDGPPLARHRCAPAAATPGEWRLFRRHGRGNRDR